MADFIMGMKGKLDDINVESFNSLIMKVGKFYFEEPVSWTTSARVLGGKPH